MNWIRKIKQLGKEIKGIAKKFPTKKQISESLFVSCCKPILRKKLEENLFVCPDCNRHHPITPSQRFSMIFQNNNYKILDVPMPDIDEDPLNWVDSKPYKEKLKEAKKKSNLKCSLAVAQGELSEGLDVVAVASDFKNFFGASISIAEGESILYACEKAIFTSNPLLIFSQGGGQRMQTSPYSLSQMARTALGVSEVKRNNLPVIIVQCSPTSGGITASYGSLGDILIAESKDCQIMFAGPRVIKAANTSEVLHERLARADYVLEKGFLDFIADRKDLREKIIILLRILLKKNVKTTIHTSEETGAEQSSKQTLSIPSKAI